MLTYLFARQRRLKLNCFILISILTGVCTLFRTPFVLAQDYTLEEVKAALLIQLVRNVEWPNETDKSSFNLYVWQDAELYVEFTPLNQLSVRDKPIRVQLAEAQDQLGDADLIYISEAHLAALQNLSYISRGKGGLLVTEQKPNAPQRHDQYSAT